MRVLPRRRKPQAIPFRLLIPVLAAVAVTAGAAPVVMPAQAAPAVPAAASIPVHLAAAVLQPVRAVPALPLRYTVRAGDTLSGLAVRYCGGNDKDWTGFYHDNRAVIGADPNAIVPGQRLSLLRCTDPPALLRLGSVQPHRAASHAIRHSSAGKTWKVTYGYPYKCGDGDGDGWDTPCSAPQHIAAAVAVAARPRAIRTFSRAAVSYAGHYSYAGLEALWISAGGPSWAAAHAASIAECESGGNVNAYNPSGATGLWQILGSVVPGSLYNPYANAANAVAKFRASGGNFSAWVCQ